jgi:hypothetical protein
MPRHTHPRPRRKHSRGHTRYHRDRYITKRWRLAKRIYSDELVLRYYWDPRLVSECDDVRIRNLLHSLDGATVIHPEVIRHLPTDAVSPGLWPFYLERNRFARNRFNTCSCLLCQWDKKVEPPGRGRSGVGESL